MKILKSAAALVCLLLASDMWAQEAIILVQGINGAENFGQTYVKRPHDRNFIKPENEKTPGVIILPQNSLICVSNAINPEGTKYLNYYFIVKVDQWNVSSTLTFFGSLQDRSYRIDEANSAKLFPYAEGDVIPEGFKKYVIEKTACAGGYPLEHGAAIDLGGSKAYLKYLYIKSHEIAPNANYFSAENTDYLGEPYKSNLPIGTVVCASVTLFPGLRYANYYFKVTKAGYTKILINGGLDYTEASFEDGIDGAGLGKPLRVIGNKFCP